MGYILQKLKTTVKELKLILEEGEGYFIEFKERVNSDLNKELVAFANASGGRIFIGINDRSEICGSDLSNKTTSQIQTIAESCDPPVSIKIEKLTSKNVIVIHIPESSNKPHRCNKGFYLRNGANSQKMTTGDIADFIQAEGKIRFDEQLRLDSDWKNILDRKKLDNYLELSGITPKKDLESLLFNLGAGEYSNESFYLNNAGVLFFAKEPTTRMFHVSVVCALYKGTSKANILIEKNLKEVPLKISKTH